MTAVIPSEVFAAVDLAESEVRCYWCGEAPETTAHTDVIGITGDMPFPGFRGGDRVQAEYLSEDGKFFLRGTYAPLCENCTKLNDHLWDGVSRTKAR